MNNFVFVILHYCTISDTLNCVDSIVGRIDTINYTIIIVDNGSPNDTGKQLVDIFKDNKKIIILLNKKNIGFSKGNNIGFHYAKNNLAPPPQFIVMLNSDTLLMQDDFCKTIQDEYDNSDFAVMGPQIHGPDGISDNNPGRSFIATRKVLWRQVIQMTVKLFFFIFHLDSIVFFIQKTRNNLKKEQNKEFLTDKRIENVVLHGCCLVFSRKYIDIFDGLDPRTFLYMEEEILYLHTKIRGLLTVYNPKLKIYHMEDAATNYIYSKPHKKRVFNYKNRLKSLLVYIKILRENGMP